MSRVCELTGKRPATANHVSHANNRTKRWQLPNLQEKSWRSELLGQNITLRLSTNAMRTIDKFGGLDDYMTNVKNRRTETFSTHAKKVRKLILKKVAEQAPA